MLTFFSLTLGSASESVVKVVHEALRLRWLLLLPRQRRAKLREEVVVLSRGRRGRRLLSSQRITNLVKETFLLCRLRRRGRRRRLLATQSITDLIEDALLFGWGWVSYGNWVRLFMLVAPDVLDKRVHCGWSGIGCG
jgi:hypothetical protein